MEDAWKVSSEFHLAQKSEGRGASEFILINIHGPHFSLSLNGHVASAHNAINIHEA